VGVIRSKRFQSVSRDSTRVDSGPQEIPSSVYDDVDDSGVPVVLLPSDQILLVDDPIQVTRSDVEIDFAGSALVQTVSGLGGVGSNWRPLEITSTLLSATSGAPGGYSNRFLYRGTGEVLAATTSFTLHEWPDPPPQTGHRCVGVFGVGTGDWKWGQYEKGFVVQSFTDNLDGTATLVTAGAAGHDVVVWDDFEDLIAASSDNNEGDPAAWGTPFPPEGPEDTMPMSFGLGDTHGWIFFSGGQPVRNVAVTNARFGIPGLTTANAAAAAPDGGAYVWASYLFDCEINVSEVNNSPVQIVHLDHCFNCTVMIGSVSGVGVTNNGGQTRPCPAVSLYGGHDNVIRQTDDWSGNGFVAYAHELIPLDTSFVVDSGTVDFEYVNPQIALVKPHTMFGAYWSMPGGRATGLSVTQPAFLTAATVARDMTFEDTDLVGGLVYEAATEKQYFLPTNLFPFDGYLRVAGDGWTAPWVNKVSVIEVEFTSSPRRILPPRGLIRRARWRFFVAGGETSVTDGRLNDFSENIGTTDWTSPTDNGPGSSHYNTWYTLPPDGYGAYLSWCELRVWGAGANCVLALDCDVYLDSTNTAGQDEWRLV
jgi:hypothetical protein